MRKQEQIEKWINALRSGNYKQSKRTLQDENGYCCLGVACKILIPKNKLVLNGFGFVSGGFPGWSQAHSPKWLNEANHYVGDKVGRTLGSMNDSDDMSFDEIADVLELIYIHKAI